jgi:hypothetical protein
MGDGDRRQQDRAPREASGFLCSLQAALLCYTFAILVEVKTAQLVTYRTEATTAELRCEKRVVAWSGTVSRDFRPC